MGYDLVLVRVWNDNEFPYREKFKDNEIVIQPRKFIEMELNEAVEFLGSFTPIVRDADGQPDPRSYKKLRIEKTAKQVPVVTKPVELTCQMCAITFKNQKELDDHIDENHLSDLADEKEADKRRKAVDAKKVLS